MINNPSNPTGAVYGRTHLEEIVEVAARLRVTIVADEIYGDLVFGGRAFHPMADVADGMGRRVPVITASGLGKQCECCQKLLAVLVDRKLQFTSLTHSRIAVLNQIWSPAGGRAGSSSRTTSTARSRRSGREPADSPRWCWGAATWSSR